MGMAWHDHRTVSIYQCPDCNDILKVSEEEERDEDVLIPTHCDCGGKYKECRP